METNSGKFTIRNGRNWSTNFFFTNSGTLTIGQGSTFEIIQDPPGPFTSFYTLTNTSTGIIKGKGTLRAPVINNGKICPGESPGLLTIDGDVTESSTSVLELEIGGTNRGVDYDALDVTGNMAFDGTLRLLFVDGYVPEDFTAFHFVNAGSISGSFSSYDLPALPDGRTWDLSQLALGNLSTTPEPSGIALLIGGLLAMRRSRRVKLR